MTTWTGKGEKRVGYGAVQKRKGKKGGIENGKNRERRSPSLPSKV